MNYFFLILIFVFFTACTSATKKHVAPSDVPRPAVRFNSERISNNITAISKNITSANLRAEKIKILLDNTNYSSQ